LSWTLDEFYADGGTAKFADRIAAVLGIHASTIKVVAVYKGSVIIDFFIQAEDDDDNADATLNALSDKFAELLRTGDVDLGAPILGAYTGGENIDVPQVEGSAPAGFARPEGANGPATTQTKQGSAFEWNDAVEQNAITSNTGSVRVGTVAQNGQTEEAEDKAKVYIVLLCVAGAVLVAIVLAVALRFFFIKRQEITLANLKESNDGQPALDAQVHGRDFDDIFAAKN